MRRYWEISIGSSISRKGCEFDPVSGAYNANQAADTAVKIARNYPNNILRITPSFELGAIQGVHHATA